MEEISNVAVLLTRSSSSSAAPVAAQPDPSQTLQHQQAADSLIQVIEKLSKIVETRPQHRFSLAGHSRAVQLAPPRGRGEKGGVTVRRGGGGGGGGGGGSPGKRLRRSCGDGDGLDGGPADGPPPLTALNDGLDDVLVSSAVQQEAAGPALEGSAGTGTCYQCSLCPYLSPTLPLLKEHLKQHDELHTDLLLMCSRCHFTSQDQALLEAHVQQHLGTAGHPEPDRSPARLADWELAEEEEEEKKKKKWYSYEEYGLYRCLICSYVCSQQRMLKTHAWKHAGLVDCSYPVFEDEEERTARREVPVSSSAPATGDKVVVLSTPTLRDKVLDQVPTAFRLQLFATPIVGEGDGEGGKSAKDTTPHILKERQKLADEEEQEEEEGGLYPVKHLDSEEPMLEVQVKTEEDCDLLSSAQKIIHSGPNSADHINVIVERLPSAEDPLLLLGPDLEQQQQCSVKKEGAVLDDGPTSATLLANREPAPDENMPPLVAGRKRTHSESLRLHSLAAEALVAMPMRTPEASQSQGQRSPPPPARAQLREEGEERGEEEDGPATKAGISLSLLTVIERLRERSDQNASDEDILKELRDNAQLRSGPTGGAVEPGTVAGSRSVCSISGVDELVTSSSSSSPSSPSPSSSCASLVEFLPGSERPYRCRLCRYSSANRGYVKQHLRVHRQRQPYQCPICEHVASDSQDLESHMIHHCKARSYQCRRCPQAFHYKNQLRSHEREQHGPGSDPLPPPPLTGLSETLSLSEEAEPAADEELGTQKTYKCDVCDYTSATFVGVRNHRRIHNSDKPYRCCSCDFATTNMNSLKSHLRRHPQEQQAVQLLEQYRCSLCGYVCSHPPSLKSHMWKHAGDQNYNYEQVNRAINEAISQSSRGPQRLSLLVDPLADRTAAAPPSLDRTAVPAAAPLAVVEPDQSTREPCSSPEKEEQQEQHEEAPLLHSRNHPQTGPTCAPAGGTEYCMLLFCCCICGFESTSKERLMEHMKEHEGDIISIILSREQQQEQQLQTEAQSDL